MHLMNLELCNRLAFFFFLSLPPNQLNTSTCSKAFLDSRFFLSQVSQCESSWSFSAFNSLSAYSHYVMTAFFLHCLEIILSKWIYRTVKALIFFAALIPISTPPVTFTFPSSLCSWDTDLFVVLMLWPNFSPFVWNAFSLLVGFPNDFVMSANSSNAFSHVRPPFLPEAELREAYLLLFFCFWYTVTI